MSTHAAPDIPYYSAHTGIETEYVNGPFTNFLRQCDQYHRDYGYWRFQSSSDEHTAYRAGFSDPEAILIAEDCGDGPTDTIELRWVPGEAEPCQLTWRGTARQHLEVINEERTILGLPASFRGEIPTYHVDVSGALLAHRTARRVATIANSPNEAGSQAMPQATGSSQSSSFKAVQSQPISSASLGAVRRDLDTGASASPTPTSSTRPTQGPSTSNIGPTQNTSSAGTPFASPSSLPNTGPPHPRVPKRTADESFDVSPNSEISRRNGSAAVSGNARREARGTLPSGTTTQGVATPTTSLYGDPFASTRLPGPVSAPHTTNPYGKPFAVTREGATPTNSLYGDPFASTRLPGPVSAYHTTSPYGDPFASTRLPGPVSAYHTTSPYGNPFAVTREVATPTTSSHGYSIAPSPRLPAPANGYHDNIEAQPPRRLPTSLHSPHEDFSPEKYKSPYSAHAAQIAPLARTFDTLGAPTPDTLVSRTPEREDPPSEPPAFAPLPVTEERAKKIDSVPAKESRAQLHSSLVPVARSLDKLKRPFNEPPPTPTTSPIESFVDSLSELPDALDKLMDDKPLLDPASTSPSGLERGMDATMSDAEMPPSDVDVESVHDEESGHVGFEAPPPIDQDDMATYLDTLTASSRKSMDIPIPMHEMEIPLADTYGFPNPTLFCIDCGEADGHQSNCNIGGIKPAKKLNMLQERLIAEAVERFDPERWRSHIGPPLPKPLEDFATVIKEMADIVRNEESYKNDADYNGLDDDMTVLLWGLKSLQDTKRAVLWTHDGVPVVYDKDIFPDDRDGIDMDTNVQNNTNNTGVQSDGDDNNPVQQKSAENSGSDDGSVRSLAKNEEEDMEMAFHILSLTQD